MQCEEAVVRAALAESLQNQVEGVWTRSPGDGPLAFSSSPPSWGSWELHYPHHRSSCPCIVLLILLPWLLGQGYLCSTMERDDYIMLRRKGWISLQGDLYLQLCPRVTYVTLLTVTLEGILICGLGEPCKLGPGKGD